MKTKAFLFAFLFLSFSVFAQKTTLMGRISGADCAYIFEVVGNQLRPSDTLVPDAKGRYRIELQLSQPTMLVLKFPLTQSNDIQVLLLPGEKVELDLARMKDRNYMCIEKTKGSKNMDVMAEFQHIMVDPIDTFDSINSLFVLPSTTEEHKAQLTALYQDIVAQQRLDIRNLLEKNANQLISAFLVTYFEQDDLFATYISLYEHVRNILAPNYADHPFVQHLTQKLATSLGPGRMAPDIDMLDAESQHRKLSDLRGQVVLLDFWASWCRPCRMENPNVVKLYKKYHEAGFEVFSVSLDKERSAWLQAIRQDGLVWPNHVSDLKGWTSSGGAAYGITSIPATVLIDREGRIIARNLRGSELERKLKEIFGF